MTSQKRHTVLLIDDSPEDRASYRRYLQRSTHHVFDVLEAESAAKGLEIYHTSNPDVILLDYLLPDMDGLELLQLLVQQEEKPSVPIIILTGQGDEVIATQVMKNGAQDYLVKGKLTADILCKSVAYTIQQFQLQQQLKRQQQQQQIVAEISLRIRQSLNLHEILQAAVDEVRQLLQTDRVIVFRFFPDWQGVVVVESCGADWTPILSTEICDPCFGGTYAEPFKQGFVTAKSDIYAAGIRECHIELLANFQVRANLVVPIMERDELWGLLIAHHCVAPRPWQDTEIDLLRQISSQLSIALQQAALLERLQAELAERKQAEIALREKEQQLQQLSDSMPQFVWSSNAQGETEYVNRQWIEYSGLTVEQSRDPQKIAEFFHPEEAQVVSEQWAIAQANQQPLEIEARLKRLSDGMYRWFLIRSVPVFNEQGQVLRWYGTSTDIHDRKIAQLNEQFLNDLDLRLRQLSDADAMVWEAISRIGEYLNVERCVWHEVSVQEDLAIVTQDWRREPNISSVVGVTRLSESILPDMITQFNAGQPAVVPDVATHPYTAPFAQNFAERDIRAFVGIPCLYEGRWVAVLAINARTVQEWRPDQVALLQEVVARLWSIIEHTRTAQILQERERLFSTLAEALPVTIFRFDVNSHCTYINNYWTTMTGRTVNSVMGLGWLETLHPEDRDRLASAWLEWSQNAQQQGLYQNEGRLVHLSGQDVWYYIQALPEVNDNGETIGYIGVMTDITKRKYGEQMLQEREAILQLFAQYAPAGIAMFDREMRYVIASQRWTEDYDQGPLESMIGRSIYDLFPDLPERWRQVHQRCLAGAIEKCNEDLFVWADGRQQWIRWETRPWYTATHEIGGIIIFAEDITQRKQSESTILQLNQELQQKVTELQTLLEVIPIGIGIADDPECQHIRVNPAFADALGIPPTVNASLSAPEEERPTTFKVYQNGREMTPEELPLQYAAAHNVELRDLEVDVVWQDGTTVTLLEYAAPLLDESGQPRGSVGAFLNITDRKRAEVALRESQERYRTLARNFPNGAVFLFDQDLRYVLAEGQGLAQVDLDRASLEGKTIWDVLDAETCRLLEPLYREALSGHAQTMEIPFGDRIYSVHCLPICDDQGFIKLGMLMSQDITLQKQAEQVLRTARDELERQVQERTRELQEANILLAQREREFRTLVENTPDVITRHDRQYRYLYINPASMRVTGIPPEFYLGKKPSELGYPEEITRFWEASLESVFVTGEMRIDEFEVMNWDEPQSYQVYVVPEREDDQSIGSVMTIARDITQLRQAEQSTRKLAEELQRSNQELEQFAYVASHDLQEPLRAITSFTQLLAEEYREQLDGDADMYIEFIVDGATRMQQLIRDLLRYSRVSRYELQLQPVDCNALLERVKNDLQVAIAENQAIITADPLPTITADPNQMANLLQNLIGNSLKYRSETDPKIHISARRHRVEATNDLSHSGSSPLTRGPEEWLFSLQDNGIGIEPQYAERIFGIFQRLHTSDEYSGTGLGLAICQKIIERHQGRIWVESQLGQGATFFFTIPLSIRTHDDNPRPITQNPAR